MSLFARGCAVTGRPAFAGHDNQGRFGSMAHTRLSKAESRTRFAEGRALWNEFDPIGVAHDVSDEYDNYVGPCLRIVEAGGGAAELSPYVTGIVFEYMGLSRSDYLETKIEDFSRRFEEWHRQNWYDTI